jgi:endonuclease YncB( thermonuclease family)
MAQVFGPAVVTDGDTLKIGRERIRLFGIDAPEGKQSCERDGVPWLCGQEAGAYLRKLVGGESLTCAQRNKDRYGRVVATCKLPDGRDIGAVMVGAGLALAYRRYGGKLYDTPEAEAKAAKRGVWAGTFIRPWEWRRAQ